MRRPALTFLGIFVLALTGCITTLDVRKTGVQGEKGPQGIRYSLPVPLLKACPGPDGTLEVTEFYVPDEDNRYAISAHTVGAKFNLNVDIKDGLLKKLDWNPDSTAVAEKVAESTGNLVTAKINADAKAAEDAAKKRAEDAKARKDALEAADKAVQEAEAELDSASAVLAAVQQGGSPAQILDAEVNVAKARAKVESAVKARTALRQSFGLDAAAAPAGAPAPPPDGGGTGPGAVPGGNDPSSGSPGAGAAVAVSASALPTAFGCVVYRIVETANSLKMEPVVYGSLGPQGPFETSFKVTPAKKDPPPPEPRFRFEVSHVVRPQGRRGVLVRHVVANIPIDAVTLVALESLSAGKDVTKKFPPALDPNGSGFRIELHDRTPAGFYKLTFSYVSPALKAKTGSDELQFEVRR